VESAAKGRLPGGGVLGVTGEANRLTDSERRLVSETVIKAAKSRFPVICGVLAPTGTEMAIQRSIEATDLGASAVMISPVPVAKQKTWMQFSTSTKM